jgi:hypothetical protein
MHPFDELTLHLSRRHFLCRAGLGLGAALGCLLNQGRAAQTRSDPLAPRQPTSPRAQKASSACT